MASVAVMPRLLCVQIGKENKMAYDYRDELTDSQCEAALNAAIDSKNWWSVCYWAKLIANRERRAKGLPPVEN